MPDKLTDSEIVKALEEELKTALIINHRFEESNDTENPDDHRFIALLSRTIKLINRLQAENERLSKDLKNNRKAYDRLIEELANAKAEAYKEFAEAIFELFPKDKSVTHISRVTVKYILKELVGDSNEN